MTVRIEAKGDVASVQEVSTQNFQLIGREGVDEIPARSGERLLRQKCVCRARRDQRIVDADNRGVLVGEMGTLKIKGDSAALCYWNAHEKSKETFAGDWCTTGDQFHVDEEGYYWYHGRTDDMLKVGGIFVAPSEIENCLLQHEAVLECVVVGHDSGDGLVKPKAFVVAREGHEAGDALAEDIKQFVKARIALYKYPRWIEFVPSLPKNDRGKIDRKLLKH